MSKLLLLIFLILQAALLNAGWTGYDIYRCGAKGLGVGGAFTAIADDSSAVYYNPAGLVQLNQFTIFYTMDTQLQLSVLSPTIKLTWKVPALLGFVVPSSNSYKTTFSFAIDSPFQRKIPNEFAIYKFAPQFATEILENLAWGINVGLMYATYGNAHGPYGLGVGLQTGLIYSPYRELHFGINYASPFTITWNQYNDGMQSVPETFPDIITLGAAVLATDKLIISFDLEFQDWTSVKVIENGQNIAPVDQMQTGLFKTIQPHLGFMFLEEETGAHVRLGLYTDSYVQNITQNGSNNLTNDTQLIWTIGVGASAFKIIKFEIALADSYLTQLIDTKNNRIETIQITAEYRF